MSGGANNNLSTTSSPDYRPCRVWLEPLEPELTELLVDTSPCQTGQPTGQLPLPQPQGRLVEPVARFRNLASTSLTDQINGLVMVLSNEYVEPPPPRGTYVYDNCLKVEGSLTTQINGMVVGVHGGCTNRQPTFPGIQGGWNDCGTVEKLPNGVEKTEKEIEIGMQLDVEANHTVQINGGLITNIVENRMIVPQVRQSSQPGQVA
ncbi:unnamed protein product [Clonostachys solani]|uniref:Uncharacterized protein n=1 Tax=Clonostachys solani TaxID=160281 RepID=A0A9N9ZIX2_9HYPO|nr:unnamed protein product [Clonostachys solani]